jgi:uncharacterized protein involved in exopolysaccharide biosynthesis
MENDKQDKDIIDLLMVLAKYKRFIFIVLAIVSLGSVTYALLAPQYWASAAIIKPISSEETSGIQKAMGGLLGGSFMLGSSDFSGTDLVTILESRSVSEDVIRHFNLIPYFKIEEKDSLRAWDKALLMLRKKMRIVDFDEDTGTVSIKIVSKDRQLSADIANYYWTILDDYNQHTRVTKGRLNRIFLENRVHEVKHSIDSLSVVMRDFMTANNTVALDSQTEQTVTLYAGLIAEQYKADMEYEGARKFSDPSAPQVALLGEKARLLGNKVKEMERGNGKSKPEFVLDLGEYPTLQYQYMRIYIDLEVQKQVFEYLYPEYEKAKIEEQKDLPTVQLIDQAKPAGLREKPKRALLCITNFVLALVLSIVCSFIAEYLSQKRDKIRELRSRILS